MTKPFILRIGGLCKSGDTMIVTLNSYNGHYIGLFHIRGREIEGKELQAQFRASNINKIALIKDKEFISANNLVNFDQEEKKDENNIKN